MICSAKNSICKSKRVRKNLAGALAFARAIMAIYTIYIVHVITNSDKARNEDLSITLSIVVAVHQLLSGLSLSPLFKDHTKNKFSRIYFYGGMLLGSILWGVNLNAIVTFNTNHKTEERCTWYEHGTFSEGEGEG